MAVSNKILSVSLVVSLAGFLFGFDTVVISGADQILQDYWQSSDLFHGLLVMSTALWGTVAGALLGHLPTNRFGRKSTLALVGGLFFLSALGSALADDPWVFGFFRFIGGLGIGISTITAPGYVAEIAPPHRRGRLVALYQFNIVFGILIAFISNFLLRETGHYAWRYMLGVEALPALLYLILVMRIPESPRWLLVYRNNRPEAMRVLKLLNTGPETADEMLHFLDQSGVASKSEHIYMRKYRRPMLLAFCIAFFNQFSGINAFLYYAPRIFELAGLAQSTALLSTIGVGVVNLFFTLLGIFLIDKTGRKSLLLIGSIGYILSLTAVSVAFAQAAGGHYIPVFFFLFIASHAIGQGAVIWVFISEIFPTHLRASGQAFGSAVHWFLAAAIPALIPLLFGRVGPAPVFLVFGLMMVLQLLWVILRVPETKGRSLEKLATELSES